MKTLRSIINRLGRTTVAGNQNSHRSHATMGGGTLLILAVIVFASPLFAQTNPFLVLVDPVNPILADVTVDGLSGVAWVDYDNDGWLDLFVCDAGDTADLYHNEGGGVFTKITDLAMVTDTVHYRGVAWVDFDNDGDVDCMLASETESALFRNDSGTFTKLPISHLGRSDTRGWSPAFGDYDNDNVLDLLVTFPSGALGTDRGNFFVRGNGPPDFTFTSIDTGVLVTGVDKYKSANWADYDDDGDMDVFIGVGPIQPPAAPDYLYRNRLTETGLPGFERITDDPIATQNTDGHMWDFIDYDNDGDLDAYQVNYGGFMNGFIGLPNRLYRNDGGTYVIATEAGSITTQAGNSLSCSWGDCDNDGDLDCVVANQVNRNHYFSNNGNGTFILFQFGFSNALSTTTTMGDYDNDGDLDLFMMGSDVFNRLLFYNNTDQSNPQRGWLKLRLVGTYSNGSAIGAYIRAKATIDGSSVWQHRTISAQNTFLGHNSLIVHFGFGDATTVDSLIIEWPSGIIWDTTGIAVNQMLTFLEDCPDSDGDGVTCVDNCPNDYNPDQGDIDSNGLGDVCDCACPCHADPDCDSLVNVFDVIEAVDVAFRSETPVMYPACPNEQTDVNCNAITDVFDVIALVDVAFRGGDPNEIFCDPCAL